MRCGICGSEEGTAGCTTPWKHGTPAVPVSFAYAPSPDPRDAELATLRAALSEAQRERDERADAARRFAMSESLTVARNIEAESEVLSNLQRAEAAESQRDRAVEVLRLLCDAAFVSDTQFVCPNAFEPAVRAARALLKEAGP